MTHSYETRLRRVLRYIHDNPAGDLSLDALADVAALSRFHWHRIFTEMTGETCAQAVRRIRAHRAAHWLRDTDDPIDRIAARAGYDNPQSFARTFRDIYGVTPLAFRNGQAPDPVALPRKKGVSIVYDVTIRDLPDHHLSGQEHVGPYYEIGKAYEQVGAVFSARNLWDQARGMVAVYYDDPTAVAPDALRSFAGVAVDPAFEPPSDLITRDLAGGRHAVIRFKGPYTGLQAAYSYLYGQWFADSGEVPGDGPSFEIYLNSPQDTAPADLLTDICAPLK